MITLESRPSRLATAMLDLLLPPLCLGCGEYDSSRRGVCDTCLMRFDRFAHPICAGCLQPMPNKLTCAGCGDRGLPLFAVGDYSGPLREIVISLKFRGYPTAAPLLAQLLWEQFADTIVALGAARLVPIPLHFTRMFRRGYNQAAELARAFSALAGLPLETDMLLRSARRKPQARLNLRQRELNIRGVFKTSSAAMGAGPVLLVDDVVTSGATVREARRALEIAGCPVAGVLAVAHGI